MNWPPQVYQYVEDEFSPIEEQYYLCIEQLAGLVDAYVYYKQNDLMTKVESYEAQFKIKECFTDITSCVEGYRESK